jgi:hypothetical protein
LPALFRIVAEGRDGKGVVAHAAGGDVQRLLDLRGVYRPDLHRVQPNPPSGYPLLHPFLLSLVQNEHFNLLL